MSSVKVMSFNIQHGVGMDGELNLNRIGDVISDSGAEIVGLQEVDRHWGDRSNFEDQIKWLSEYLNMDYFYGANLVKNPGNENDSKGEYGLAILSKHPINHPVHHSLTSDQEQRGFLKAEINIAQKTILFINTHLGLSEAERDLQIKEILVELADKKNPTIIVGDFNATPTNPEMEQILTQYQDGQPSPTYPSDKPTKKIDYILTSNQIDSVNKEPIQTLSSDHLPLIAELNV